MKKREKEKKKVNEWKHWKSNESNEINSKKKKEREMASRAAQRSNLMQNGNENSVLRGVFVIEENEKQNEANNTAFGIENFASRENMISHSYANEMINSGFGNENSSGVRFNFVHQNKANVAINRINMINNNYQSGVKWIDIVNSTNSNQGISGSGAEMQAAKQNGMVIPGQSNDISNEMCDISEPINGNVGKQTEAIEKAIGRNGVANQRMDISMFEMNPFTNLASNITNKTNKMCDEREISALLNGNFGNEKEGKISSNKMNEMNTQGKNVILSNCNDFINLAYIYEDESNILQPLAANINTSLIQPLQKAKSTELKKSIEMSFFKE